MTPVAKWSNGWFWVTFLVLVALVFGLGYAIFKSDEPLREKGCTPKSAALEWIASPSAARQIVEDWDANGVRGIVARGVAIDFAFIVAYVLCLLVALTRCIAVVPSIPWWAAVGKQFIRWAVLAGILDVIENVGILLELYPRAYALAPLIALVAIVKWMIVVVVVIYILFSAFLAWREWAARADPLLQAELKALQ